MSGGGSRFPDLRFGEEETPDASAQVINGGSGGVPFGALRRRLGEATPRCRQSSMQRTDIDGVNDIPATGVHWVEDYGYDRVQPSPTRRNRSPELVPGSQY